MPSKRIPLQFTVPAGKYTPDPDDRPLDEQLRQDLWGSNPAGPYDSLPSTDAVRESAQSLSNEAQAHDYGKYLDGLSQGNYADRTPVVPATPRFIAGVIGPESKPAASPSAGTDTPEDAGASSVKAIIAKKYGFGPGLDDASLRSAQLNQADREANANVGEAGDQLAYALAGGSAKSDPSFFRNLAKNADSNVKDILTRRQGQVQNQQFAVQQEANDATGPAAAAIRRLYGPAMQQLGLPPDTINNLSPEMVKSFVEKPMEFMEKLKSLKLQRDMMVQEWNFKHLEHAQDTLNKDPEYSAAIKAMDTATETKRQIQEAMSNPAAAAVLPVELARDAVKGSSRINQIEIAKAGGSQALLDKAMQLAETMKSGKLTPENAGWLIKLNEMRQNEAQAAKDRALTRLTSQYAQRTGKDADSARVDLTGSTAQTPSRQPSAGLDTSDPRVQKALNHGYTPEEIASYLNGRK